MELDTAYLFTGDKTDSRYIFLHLTDGKTENQVTQLGSGRGLDCLHLTQSLPWRVTLWGLSLGSRDTICMWISFLMEPVARATEILARTRILLEKRSE